MEPHTNNMRLALIALCLVVSANSARLGPKLPLSHPPSQSESPLDLTEQISSKLKPNPRVKKICDQTDHPSLCMATVIPLVKAKPDVDAVLQVAVQASSAYAKQALAEAKKLASNPGTPKGLLATLRDCQDGYDSAVENFQRTLEAFATNDLGTMRTMLSAVITFVGDCQDQFTEMQIQSPLTGYGEQLTEMASNCLAISELKM